MTFKQSLPDRLRASGIHLASSSLIFIVYIYFVLVNWYPEPYFTLEGAVQVTVTLIGVDLVVGPLLTFVVYVKNKKGLKLDLTLIILTQIAFLIWGVWVTYKEHPVFAAFAIDQIQILRADKVREFNLDRELFAGQPEDGFRMLYVLPPQDQKDKSDLVQALIAGKGDIHNFPERYRKIADNQDAVRQQSRDILRILKQYPAIQVQVDGLIERYPGSSTADFVYIPIEARKKYYTIVLKKDDLRYAGYLDVDSWDFK